MADLRIFSCIIYIIVIIGVTDVAAQGELHCYTCLDIFVEGERLNPAEFGGVDLGSCKTPSLEKCEDGETCFFSQVDLESTFSGGRVKAEVTFSQCLDHSTEGLDDLPEEGCVDTNKAFDAEKLGNYLGITFHEHMGVACSCLTPGCNDPRDLGGHYCYNCLDLNMVGSPQGSPFHQEVYAAMVYLLFDGVVPSSCESPYLQKCDAAKSCFVMQSESDVIHDDIPEKLNQTFSKCMSQGILNFDDDMPEDGCVDTNKVFDKDILATAFESTFLDLFGVACTCPSTGCNDPRVEIGLAECNTLTCENEGTCVVTITGVEKCVCPNWYTGERCQELKKFQCEGQSPCHDDEPLFSEDGIRHFPHLTMPDMYVQCGAGGACYERTCDPGLEWDYRMQTCDWAPTK